MILHACFAFSNVSHIMSIMVNVLYVDKTFMVFDTQSIPCDINFQVTEMLFGVFSFDAGDTPQIVCRLLETVTFEGTRIC